MNKLTKLWFEKWQKGDIQRLPISEDFVHISPYGTIKGKKDYLELINDNLDKFLNHEFEIHDVVEAEGKSCIRYTAVQGEFQLEVTEWHYFEGGLINKIIAYYNIEEEIDESRKLKNLK